MVHISSPSYLYRTFHNHDQHESEELFPLVYNIEEKNMKWISKNGEGRTTAIEQCFVALTHEPMFL